MAIRWSVDFENVMGSIQRILEYAKLEPEDLGEERNLVLDQRQIEANQGRIEL